MGKPLERKNRGGNSIAGANRRIGSLTAIRAKGVRIEFLEVPKRLKHRGRNRKLTALSIVLVLCMSVTQAGAGIFADSPAAADGWIPF